MLQCITSGSASAEGGEELEDGINLNVTARVILYLVRIIGVMNDAFLGVRHIVQFISDG